MLTPDRMTTTTCPFCGVGCKLQLHIKDDAIYQVTSPGEAVVNHGNLCVKGRFGTDFIHHRKRVTTPLIRREPQTPVDLVTVRLTAIEAGPAVELAGDGDAAAERIAGPVVLHLPETTVAIPAGWSGATDGTGTLVLERGGA